MCHSGNQASPSCGGGRSCAVEVIIPPHRGSDLHVHEEADEQFYILDGEVTMLGEETCHAAVGT